MPRRCCIPGCKSNYDSTLRNGGETFSTFSFPRDEDRKSAWIRAIPRADWTPAYGSVVCSKHFDSAEVIRTETANYRNGTSEVITLTKPKLVDGAVPHIFPNLPGCLSKTDPSLRREKYEKHQEQLREDFMKQDLVTGFHNLDGREVLPIAMTELDKFKRRLIRTVARLLRQQDQPGDAVWEELQKETGCDCQLLWKRMKALTMKKMKRLLLANDRVDNIAAVARMSVTDWLLFDLVLAHEKFDVIGKDMNKEIAALDTLFTLVHRFGVEHLQGDAALEGWVNLTLEYNSRGRRASPMLLQRRWYQMKEHTRESFYKLWHNYRGNAKLWDTLQDKPTALNQAIAKRYPHVVTKPFMEWEEMVEKRHVVLPEEFENRTRKKEETGKRDDNPDLIMIEPVIETIDLGAESDDETRGTTEQAKTLSNVATERDDEDSLPPFNLSAVKQEPIEDGLSNVQILEATHIPTEDDCQNVAEEAEMQIRKSNLISQINSFITEDEVTQSEGSIEHIEESIEQIESPNEENIEPIPTPDENNDDIDIPDELIKQKADEYINSKKLANVPSANTLGEQDNQPEDDVTEGIEVDNTIKKKADDFVRKVDIKKLVSDVVEEYKLPTEEDTLDPVVQPVDNIEIVDEGIEYIEDEEYGEYAVDPRNDTQTTAEVKEENSADGSESSESEDSGEDNVKIDLKLLMNPVVYTTKLDDMIMFQGHEFESINKLDLINSVIIKSKPVSAKGIKVELETDPAVTDEPEVTVEPELLKESTEGEITTGNDSISPSPEPDDTDDISDDLKVKPNSYLLKKPRRPTYNPIQLCKNPDFNTRLKRLTAGFFSLERNRQLLSACKPMTIDLHKTFEMKLIDGTLYLKKHTDFNSETPVKDKETHSAPVSVLPSAMPVQSLISKNLNVDINDLVSRPSKQLDTVDLTQRSKVINLRDLSEIRRINQHLLTAQVPPMRVDAGDSDPGIDTGNTSVTDSGHKPVQGIETDYKPVTGIKTDYKQVTGIETYDKPVTGIDTGDTSEEPKIVSVSGGQDLMARSICSGRGGWQGRGRGRGSRGGGMAVSWKPKPTPWRSALTPSRCHAGFWNKPAKTTRPSYYDDALLTIDTLNRMINKLYGGHGDYAKHGKVYHHQCVDITDDKEEVDKTPGKVPPIPEQESNPKPRPGQVPKTKPKIKPSRKKVLYCCWSAEKLAKFGTKRRVYRAHACPPICQCCCRMKLVEAMAEFKAHAEQQVKDLTARAQKDKIMKMTPIVLSDDESNSATLTEVTTTNHEECVPTPKLRVIPWTSLEKDKSCTHGNTTCTSSCLMRGLPMDVTAVSNAEQQPPADPQQPVLRINVSFSPTPVTTAPPIPNYDLTTQNTHTSPTKITKTYQKKRAIVIDGASSSPFITIDGASPPTMRTKKNERSLLLNSKNIIKKPKECPVYLGQNKILLTTVKFPPNFDTHTPIVPTPPPKVIPCFSLPAGVQLILMANGELTYTLEPGITLTEEQISVMPSILAAVQQQVNASQGQIQEQSPIDSNIPANVAPVATPEETEHLPVIESIKESNDITVPTQDVEKSKLPEPIPSEKSVMANCASIDTNQEPEKEKNCDIEPGKATVVRTEESVLKDNVENEGNVEASTSETLVKNSELSSSLNSLAENAELSGSLNSSSSSEIITVEETSGPTPEAPNVEANKATESNHATAGSRNLLSDLMEMSGISAEDARPQEIPVFNPPGTHSVIRQLANIVDSTATPMIRTINSPPPIIPIENASVPQMPIQSITTTAVENVSSATEPLTQSDILSLPELTPITSLAELKYACEQNGQFFKLDFDTGIVVPINVSIQKTKPKPISLNMRTIAPKSVIDLTDDTEVSPADEPPPEQTSPVIHVPALSTEPVKPVKLFRSAFTAKQPSLLKRVVVKVPPENRNNLKKIHLRKQRLDKIEANIDLVGSEELRDVNRVSDENPRRVYKRKLNMQKKDKIDARIDIVDSDAPMEEEYLVESSDSEGDKAWKVSLKPSTTKQKTPIEDSDDDSDDEPLAKKSLRIRGVEPKAPLLTQAEVVAVYKSTNDKNTKKTENSLKPMVTNADTTQKAAESETQAGPPQASNPAITEDEKAREVDESDTNTTEMDLEDTEMVSFLADESESQEDCILGV